MKKKLLALILVFISIFFIFIHTSSNRALRFKVFLFGFPKESITSNIDSVFKGNDHIKYYILDPTPVSSQTGPMNAWQVKKVGIFYFAKYFGAL